MFYGVFLKVFNELWWLHYPLLLWIISWLLLTLLCYHHGNLLFSLTLLSFPFPLSTSAPCEPRRKQSFFTLLRTWLYVLSRAWDTIPLEEICLVFVRKYQGRYSFLLNLAAIPKAGQQSCKHVISCLKIRQYRETETSDGRHQFHVHILTLKEAVLQPSLSLELSVTEVNTSTSLVLTLTPTEILSKVFVPSAS